MSNTTQKSAEAAGIETAPAARTEVDREKAAEARRRRLEVSGGLRLKLSVVGSIPGFHLFWQNDENAEIAMLLDEGFSFVTQSELGQDTSHVVADAEITDRISRHVGKKSDDSPLRAYLLKIPEDMWAEFDQARHEQADRWEADILRNRKTELESEERYVPSGLKTSIKQETK